MKLKLFTAKWCGPCKQLKQWLENENIEGIEIVDIDTPEGSNEAAKVGIRGIPALLTEDKTVLTTNEVIRPYITGLNA
mgnify:CR=1 FL=1